MMMRTSFTRPSLALALLAAVVLAAGCGSGTASGAGGAGGTAVGAGTGGALAPAIGGTSGTSGTSAMGAGGGAGIGTSAGGSTGTGAGGNAGAGNPAGGGAAGNVGAGGMTGGSGTGGKGCSSDGACRVLADYCTGCDCRALATGEVLPPCAGPGVRCLADPCMNKKAACQKGRCVVVDALPSVRPGKPAYDPCAGKKCGDMCHLCPPDAADCMETAQVKQCNAAGKCGAEAPACP